MADTKSLSDIRVADIQCIGTDPDIFVGRVMFHFDESLAEGRDTSHSIAVKLRITHSRASSIESLQEQFLKEALGLMRLVAQHGNEGCLQQFKHSLSSSGEV